MSLLDQVSYYLDAVPSSLIVGPRHLDFASGLTVVGAAGENSVVADITISEMFGMADGLWFDYLGAFVGSNTQATINAQLSAINDAAAAHIFPLGDVTFTTPLVGTTGQLQSSVIVHPPMPLIRWRDLYRYLQQLGIAPDTAQPLHLHLQVSADFIAAANFTLQFFAIWRAIRGMAV